MKSVSEVPFNRFLGLEPGGDETHLLRLPASPNYLNHLGTIHAAAQLALAEASSGEFLLRHLPRDVALAPVVRRVEAKFRNPGTGALTSQASVPNGALDQIAADLHRRSRAFISVAVELHDESGTHTLSATVEWFLQKIDPT
ncbi:MAG: YiiD C-terminal domain-containing protein [Verrucomicrobiota bacterium]|nr:YiiD C-terminal domain-containing protein [Verrucomicrobiota bacterium]